MSVSTAYEPPRDQAWLHLPSGYYWRERGYARTTRSGRRQVQLRGGRRLSTTMWVDLAELGGENWLRTAAPRHNDAVSRRDGQDARLVLSTDLVGPKEIATRAGTTGSAVSNWIKRHPGTFPEPVCVLGRSGVYLWPEVERWLSNRTRKATRA